MQSPKHSMFQSFMKKKELISKMITDSKSTSVNRQKHQFKHFQAVSQPVYIKAQSNAVYLTHLNTQFRDQLRQFVHQQQSYNETTFQLCKITQSLQAEQSHLQQTLKPLRTQLNEAQLDRDVLSDKNDFHLNRIMVLQQEKKAMEVRGEEYERIATQYEEDIEYENCVLGEIVGKNREVIGRLEVMAAEIEDATARLEATEREKRQKESTIKKLNADITSIYLTLQAQDDSLTTLCDNIEHSLNTQNNHINDIEFAKNNLTTLLTETSKQRKHLQTQQQTNEKLLNYGQDLEFDIRRVSKQLQIEEKGIDQQYWRITQQEQRMQENCQMLSELKQYLQNLVKKNEVLELTLEEQIIQDHTIKRIVDSKCLQPVGRKVKVFLEEQQGEGKSESKYAGERTAASWCKENFATSTGTKTPTNTGKALTPMTLTPNEKGQWVHNADINSLIMPRHTTTTYKHFPQQMQFVFEKFNQQQQQYNESYDNIGNERQDCDDIREEGEQYFDDQENGRWRYTTGKEPYNSMGSTGFTYIGRLAGLEGE